MIEKVYGKSKNPTAIQSLMEQLDSMTLSGTLYIGYPILASADETILIEALLITDQTGLVVFATPESPSTPRTPEEWDKVREQQDRLYFVLYYNLGKHSNLRKGRELGIPINVVTFFPVDLEIPEDLDIKVASPTSLQSVLTNCEPCNSNYLRALQAALQRVTTIKPVKKRALVSRNGSKGSILKAIEREIANLDKWQKIAAIESPEGPQRIRGLAGSGKTIVLALKASYLHAHNPDWNIILTFHTRSLYQQLIDLVRRFSYEHSNDEPNFEKLRIMHSWGSSQKQGVYAEMAVQLGTTPRDFLFAKSAYGITNAFNGVCDELLSVAKQQASKPLYDAVLIDEAQDLPSSFFRLIYEFTKDPKRIVWAYDELQNLSSFSMPAISDMFGFDAIGNQRVKLANSPGQPREDVILPVCYRNTPWALTLAHAIGLGIYRQGGLVQHFDEPSLWTEIGYELVSGKLEPGQRALLRRKRESYPNYFEEYLSAEDAVTCNVFADEIEQVEWLANNILKNFAADELEADDILVILPDPITAKGKANFVMEALNRKNISSHLAGVTTSQDEIFTSGSVAISNIYRAKGNEAPMVYILNCQHCFEGYELIKVRNILFTAITRSRAWIRLCGFGPAMELFKAEVELVRNNKFNLDFQIPTAEQLKKMSMIHRDRTEGERARIDQGVKGLKQFIKLLKDGEMAIENLPADMQNDIRNYLRIQEESGNDY